MALKKYCARCGCNNLIDMGEQYCSKHKQTKTERNREYDKTQRNKDAKVFYNSAAWKKTRNAVLARDNCIDVYLYVKEKRIVPATLVHHIVELREDWSKRCTMSNLISVSEKTHEGIIKTAYKKDETKKKMQKELRNAMRLYKGLGG